MTVGEAYLSFINKVEQNATNDGYSADKNRFITLFNAAQVKFVEWVLDKGNDDDRRYIQQIKVTSQPLDKNNSKDTYTSFTLPKDYLENLHPTAKIRKSPCGLRIVKLWEVKDENLDELWHDEFNSPSFDPPETYYTISGGNLNVYKKDFQIESANLTYYRYPRAADIEGYIRADGSTSSNVDPEWDDRVTERIISICAKDFSASLENTNKYQIEQNQIANKF